MRVLVVDDDEEIRVSLRRALALDGHDATLEADAEAALERLRGGERFDVVVLDRGLPGIDGVEACRRIRAAEIDIAVLMLTALGAVRDRVDGLDAGADDYVVKPFDIDEFLARVRAVARRRPDVQHSDGPTAPSTPRVLRAGDLVVDESSWTARRGDRLLELTRTEFRLLAALVERAGSVIGRAELMHAVWDYDFGTSSSNLDVYVSYLRRKLEADGEPRLVQTVRGVGYVLRSELVTTGVRFALWATIAGSLAVLLAGAVALVVVDRTLDAVVDNRLLSTVERVTNCASIRTEGAATADDQVVSILDPRDRETCRSSPVAPSPRALGLDADGFATRIVDGARWRTYTQPSPSTGGRVLVAERVEAHELARADARRAIIIAMVFGTLLAAAGGAIAAIPARRRIALLLDRIRAAGRDRSGTATVGRIGGRDLDAAAASFDELLADVRLADVAQRRLVSDAAHQLRTPITSLRTNAQLLERQAGLDPEARDLAERIARQAAAVSDLVSGIVDYTAITAWSGERAATQLGVLAADAISRAAARWPEATFTVADDGSREEVDGELVVRALGNVLDNAVVHGGGVVRVEVRDGCCFVSDDGPGFSGGDDDAFRPFSSGGDGSGLGLAFVRHVARAHGGDAWIEQQAPAVVGVCFHGKLSDSSRAALGSRADVDGVNDEG